MKRLFRNSIVLLLFSTLWACEKKMDKYYERPDWLRGSAYEVMEDRGNFDLFLRAIDRAGYKTIVNGRELCTVMAPNDEAFQKYMKRHNYSSVDDIPVDTLKMLVPYHIIKKAYGKDMMLGFTMAIGADAKGDGTAHKFETYAQPAPFTMTDPLTGKQVKTYNNNLYIPVVSTRLYKTKKCADYKSNYTFFWPDINWLGDDEQLHAQNAAVIEKGIPTDNGFMYVLDEVCEPLRTVYQALEKPSASQFSQFLKLYDRFAEVSFKSVSDVTGDSLYNYNHYRMTSKAKAVSFNEQLPALASTIAYHGDYATRDDYFMYLTYTYNCFAPTDRALEDYFSRKFASHFASWDEVPQLTLFYLLAPCVKEGQEIILPEPVLKDGMKGDFGEVWPLKADDIVTKEVCCNGMVYGVDQVFDPLVFDIVTKPLFMTPDYSIIANMFFKADAISTLTDQTADKYTLFIIADSILQSDMYNMRMNYGNNYFNDGGELVEQNGNTVGYSSSVADMSIVLTSIKDFSKRAYYSSRTGDTYFFTNNNTLYDVDGNKLEILDRWETPNGVTYAIDHMLYKTAEELALRQNTITALKDRHKEFYDLLKTAGLIKASTTGVKAEYVDGIGLVDNAKDAMKSAMYFIPEDLTAWKSLPKADLAKRLQYCIVPMTSNYLSYYVLPGVGQSGSYNTLAKSAQSSSSVNVYEKLNFSFDDYRVVLQNAAGSSTASTGEYIPTFTRDGMIIKINNTIQAN